MENVIAIQYTALKVRPLVGTAGAACRLCGLSYR